MGNTNISFGVLIKALRDERGISMYDLEQATQLSPSYICRLEKGDRDNPTISVVGRLCKFYDIPITVIGELYPEMFKVNDPNDLYSLDELILKSEFIFANVKSDINIKICLQKVVNQIENYIKEENSTRENESKLLQEIDKLKENVKSA